MDASKLGERINQRRKELNLTQKELASKIGVSDRAVSKWETGRGFPDISLMDEIAKALDLEVADLFMDEKTIKGERTMKDLVNDTIDYAKNMQVNYSDKIKRMVLITISTLCFIGILSVGIVNYVIDKELTWGIASTASIILGWLIVVPLVMKEKKGIKISLLIVSIAIIPFLYILSSSLGLDAYVLSVGWKAALFALAYAWIAYFMFATKRFEYYTIVSILIILATPLSYIIQKMVEIETGVPVINMMQYISFALNIIVASTIYIYFHERKRKALSQK